MPISAGTRLGPYEILGPLGAGGMGEVWRARDPRLNRQVAVKVLPGDFLEGKERRERFEREARILASLNHPGIAAIHSFEEIPGSSLSRPASASFHVLVMELLEGETLRARLAGGALPVRKALDYAVQIARGLAAAHEKGIVHRDLKPENLFVTKDGRAKILDFGLAKLRPPAGAGAAQTNLPTESAGTEAGVVLGTVGYMSPEQVRGEPVDARSDLFSFGTILYEMLSGVRVFRRASAAETMSAILTEEPPDLSSADRAVPAALERLVRHCLEKSPDERFQSARDLAFDLEAIATPSGAAPAVPGARASARPSRGTLVAAVLATALVCTGLSAVLLRRAPPRPPSFRQITYRRGTVWSARFGSDGKTVLYSAAWDGGPIEIHAGRTDGPDSRPFGLTGADVLAVAPSGDVAVALRSRLSPGPTIFSRIGTLARTAATGGAPREILEDVEFADFSPDGGELAVVRLASGRRRLEYPPGKSLYETPGWIGNPRVSPRGDRIAFFDHPVVGDDGGSVALVDLSGRKTSLTPTFASANGLAWSPDGSEVWFTASEGGLNRSLRAAAPSGRQRVVLAGPETLTLRDVSRDGRALLTRDLPRIGFVVRGPDSAVERDLTWFDASFLAGLSADGRTALFGETGEAGGPGYSVFLRGTEGSPAVRLGEGSATSLSPDGKRVLAIVRPTGDAQLVIHPVGPGESRPVPHPGLRALDAAWLPDGRHILLTAAEPGHLSRVYLADSEGGAPKPLTPEGYRAPPGVALVDGRRFLSLGPGGKVFLASRDGGEPVAVAGIGPEDSIPGASGREGWILVRRGRGLPAHVVRLDLSSGREERLGDLMPADPTGILDISHVHAARDGRSYGYDYSRYLSDLFVVEGLR